MTSKSSKLKAGWKHANFLPTWWWLNVSLSRFSIVLSHCGCLLLSSLHLSSCFLPHFLPCSIHKPNYKLKVLNSLSLYLCCALITGSNWCCMNIYYTHMICKSKKAVTKWFCRVIFFLIEKHQIVLPVWMTIPPNCRPMSSRWQSALLSNSDIQQYFRSESAFFTGIFPVTLIKPETEQTMSAKPK